MLSTCLCGLERTGGGWSAEEHILGLCDPGLWARGKTMCCSRMFKDVFNASEGEKIKKTVDIDIFLFLEVSFLILLFLQLHILILKFSISLPKLHSNAFVSRILILPSLATVCSADVTGLWEFSLICYGAYKKDGDIFFSRACCNTTRGDDFKLRAHRDRLRLDRRMKIFYGEGGAQVAQRGDKSL